MFPPFPPRLFICGLFTSRSEKRLAKLLENLEQEHEEFKRLLELEARILQKDIILEMKCISVEAQEVTCRKVVPPHYVSRIKPDDKSKDADYEEVLLDNEWVMDKIKFNMVKSFQATMHFQGFEQVGEGDI